MTSGGMRCTYTHDISEFSDLDGDWWHCPYERHADERCLFHIPVSKKSDAEVTDALLSVIHDPEFLRAAEDKSISSPRSGRKAFIGGRFGRLDLAHALLNPEDNQPIDFRECRFHENVDASHLECRSPVWFDGAKTAGTVVFDESVFEKEVRFNETTFRGDVSFFDTQFQADAHFTEATFNALATFYAATFVNDGKFTDAQFRGHAKFSRVNFSRRAQFGRTSFDRRTRFNGASFRSAALFDDAVFRDVASVFEATFADDARFNGTRFDSTAIFDSTRFTGDFSFIGGEISGRATFESARFEQRATLTGTLSGRLSMNRMTVKGQLDIQNLTTDERTLIQLRGSTVPEGTLACSTASANPVIYDLENACIGNIDLTGGDRLDRSIFDTLLLEQTKFDGFDFADYIDELTVVNWMLHTDWEPSPGHTFLQRFVPEVLQSPFELANSGLSASERATQYASYEGTYLRAKNGAKQIGYSRAAEHFFISELTYRRRKSFWQIVASGPPSSIRAAYQWAANSLLGGTSGYGERPGYVVLFSALLIIGFAGVYTIFAPTLYADPLSSLSLSTGAFVTLLFGSPGSITEYPLLSGLLHLEGVTGAFLIALFVFTLTRSLHR